MKKGIRGKMAILNCLLLMLPSMAWAAESADAIEETTLDEIVVSAVHLDKYLVTTTVITDKDIEVKGARTLADVLVDVPGLNLHKGKKGNTAVDIRGVTSSDVKIYVDGVLVNPLAKMTSSAAVDISLIPTNNIAKIEIIKGPAPVIYGTDAKGGVILITTKSGISNPGGNVNLETGTWGTLNASVNYGGGDKNFNYYFDAGTQNTDGYRDYNRNERYFNTKMNWFFDNKSQLTFSGGYSSTDKDCQNAIDPATGKVISSKTGFWPALNDWEFRDWERTNLSLNYVQKVNQKLDYDIKVYRFTESQGLWADGANYDATVPYKSSFGYSTSRWNASYWDSALNGAEWSGNWKPNEKNTVTVGMLYNTIDWKKSNSALADPNNYTWDKYTNDRFGYYVQDNILANDRTTVTLGVRRDSYKVDYSSTDRDGSKTSPVVNTTYQLDRRNTLRVSYGETYSFPSAEQLFGSSGNPDLKPEKSKNYEVGLKHEFDSSLNGDIAIFKNDIADKINRINKASLYENLESANIKGIELELDKKFTEKLNGFVNYTYLDASATNYSGTVTELTYTPKHHINYGLNYEADKGYRFNLTGHWVDKRYTADSVGSDTRSGSTVYSHLPSYNVVDLKISRQINKQQDWYVTVYNIFNKHYEEELFYPDPGTWVMIGTNYKF